MSFYEGNPFSIALLFFTTAILCQNQSKKAKAMNVTELQNTILSTPEQLVQEQLDAYNNRDIDAFLKPYADYVEIFTFPNELRYKGKEIMREQYGTMFKNTPNLHCELKNRIVKSNVVIDYERVQFGNQIVEAIAIYHSENGKIKKVYFMR